MSLSSREKIYQEQILRYSVVCNSICSHMAHWKCILNSPYLGECARTISKCFKILSFSYDNNNVLLVGCNCIYQTFQVLNIYLTDLLLVSAAAGKFS